MKKRTGRMLAAAVLVGGSASPAWATTYTWDASNYGVDLNWDDAANWTADSGSPITGDTATFTSTLVDSHDVTANGDPTLFANVTTVTVNVDGTQAVNTLQFSAANNTAFLIGGTSKNVGAIDLDAGGTITTAVSYKSNTSAATSNAAIINSSLVLEGDATFSQTGSTNVLANANQAPLQIYGNISGSGTITISGDTGYGITIGGANSGFTGNINLNDGILTLNGTTAVSSSNTITLATSTELGFDATMTSNYVIAGNASCTFYGVSSTESGTISVNNGKIFSIGTGGATPLITAQLEGQGNINETGGNLTLNGSVSNTLSGTFTMASNTTNNTLALSKTGGAIAIAGALTIQNKGIVVWHGNGEVANTVIPNLDGATTLVELNGFTQTFAGLTDGGSGVAGTVENNSASVASTLTLNLSGSNTFNGVIANGAAAVLNVAVSGTTGSQTLTNTNTYTGTTVISGGTLALSGSGSLGNTAISLTAGTFAPRSGAFAGSGSASLTLGSGAYFDMTGDNGSTLGAFTLHGTGTALTLSGGTLLFDLGPTSADNDSLVVASGSASVSGLNSLTIDTAGDAGLTLGDYTLISDAAGGLIPGDFQFTGGGTTQNVTVGANNYTLSLGDSNSNAEILTVAAAAPVPEPASLGLLGFAAAGLLRRAAPCVNRRTA